MKKIIKADGSEHVIPEEQKLTLEYVQGIVGGFVQMIPTDEPGVVMLLDEDGKFKNRKINELATKITQSVIAFDDYIVGDVIICEDKEFA